VVLFVKQDGVGDQKNKGELTMEAEHKEGGDNWSKQ
jgi:hypothetical protein